MESVRLADAELCSYLDVGDLRAAGGWLVRRHAHEVMSLCRAMVRDLETAEDLTQEVFGRAFTALASFRGQASSRSWILAIARNRCIDHLRAQQREPSVVARLEGSEPDHHPDDSPLPSDLIARRHQVKAALDGLDKTERALVVLRFRHGLDYEELAEVFGLREGTVRMRLSRALARMRSILERQSAQEQELPRQARVAASGSARGGGVPSTPVPAMRPAPGPSFSARRPFAEPVAGLGPSRLPPAGGAAPPAMPSRAEQPAEPRPGFDPEDRTPRVPSPFEERVEVQPAPAAALDHPLGEVLELLDPGLPLGLFEDLLDDVSRL